MKRNNSLLIFAVLTSILFCSSTVIAQNEVPLEKQNSIVFKGGVFVPKGDIDELDNGFSGEVLYNRYLTKNFAMEAGGGLYHSEGTFNGVEPVVGSYTEKDEISVVPVKFNIKAIVPFSIGEFYLGGGVGLYLATVESNITSTGLGSFSLDASDVVFGAQFKAGTIFNINEKLFFGIEGEYMITDTAEFTEDVFGVPITVESDLNGFTINGVFGFSF